MAGGESKKSTRKKQQQQQQQRRSFTNARKLEVVAVAKKKGNRAAAREAGVVESMVRRWRLHEDKIKSMCPQLRANGRGMKCRWPDLERELVSWITAQRDAGRAASTIAIRLKAINVARERGLEGFGGNPSWCQRFMKRNNLVVRGRGKTAPGHKLPEDWQRKVAEFTLFVQRIITENNFTACNVGSMDEVPMSFDAPIIRTVVTTAEKTAKVTTTGQERTNFTVVLSATADGTKLPPFIIFKRVTMPSENFPPNCIVVCNKKGWMNKTVMQDWVNKCWSKRPVSTIDDNSILVMDSIVSHKNSNTKRVLKENKTQLAIVPGGLSCKLQPLDAGVKYAFKVYARQEWESWMAYGEHEFMSDGRQKKAKFSEVCSWIVNAWAKVKKSTVVNSFRKVGIITTELTNSDSTDSESDWESAPPTGLDENTLALFHSDSEDSDFEGFASNDIKSETSEKYISDF